MASERTRARASPMSEWRRIAIAFASIALVVGACGDDDVDASAAGSFVALDGSPRVPDDAGVVTAIDADFATLTLDGEAVYEIHDRVQSFASLDGSTLPLRSRLGVYVHVGLEGDTVVWVASIGSVLRIDGQPQTVGYLAAIRDVDEAERRITLRDGTVFALADSLQLPAALNGEITDPVPATLRIGVSADEVIVIELAA